MKRVLVSEELAASGLEAMRAAGLEVDFRPGLSADDLLGAVPGAHALVIRSATQVTAEVLLGEVKVAIVPGEAFGAPGYARLSFALGDDDLGEGVRRIADFLA